ncbi:Succinate dehydrogenase assembly factor 2 mitochondrial [Malassezia obtusa]|uniref:Succinate dehydrogenase assembly factor 2, mitochondrial n=1 Tax=Malassezia obtusa TaxID=76774 RepID=A0AAF0E2W8_9BASI|nr:Succinate dehydrogenase assembly factor 2 mitochondrial [Malassezia obtusa]
MWRALHTAPALRQRQSGGGDDSSQRPPFADPFPLPFSPELDPLKKAEGVNLASESQRIDDFVVPIRVPNRLNEERPKKLARLQYQCRKRGTLETDLILSTFAVKELASLADAELDELDMLLDEPDWDIFYWCTDRKPVPERWQESFATEGRLGHRLRLHTRNDERTVRRFPQLSAEIKSPA